jgi:hypothetical protein
MNTNDEQYVESSLLRDRDGKLQDYSSKKHYTFSMPLYTVHWAFIQL